MAATPLPIAGDVKERRIPEQPERDRLPAAVPHRQLAISGSDPKLNQPTWAFWVFQIGFAAAIVIIVVAFARRLAQGECASVS